MKRWLSLKLWIPLILLAAGGGGTAYLMKRPPVAEKKAAPFKGALVSTLAPELTSTRITLQTSGQVRAARRVILTPRIAGSVSQLGPNFQEGRFFRKDEVLVRLDPLTGNARDQILLKAPFDGVVQARSSDPGQYVTPGTQLGVLVGTAQAEVLVDLPLSRLQWLDLNDLPEASVSLGTGTVSQPFPAQVQRLLPELTPQGRMARMLLTVEDPFGLNTPSPVPLFVGAFVEVELVGRALNEVFRIPAQALRDGDTVWLVNSERELQIQTVEVAHQDRNSVYITQGLDSESQVVTSPLKGAANGLKVRIEGEPEEGPPASAPQPLAELSVREES